MKYIFITCFLLTCFFSNAQEKSSAQAGASFNMKPLFNGKNLDGWYTFLRTKGKDNDPEKIFAIEDGLLHISGKEFGYICTKKVFTDFHLAVEFKWGVKKYPPREADTVKRDNGICYFVPVNTKDKVWPKSIECQIQEGDVGDFWMIDYTTIVVDGKQSVPDSFSRVVKKTDAEKPFGEWNRVEVIANKGKITHIVNGVVVNEGKNPSLTEGKILIQSEGAEIYFRKVELAQLNK